MLYSRTFGGGGRAVSETRRNGLTRRQVMGATAVGACVTAGVLGLRPGHRPKGGAVDQGEQNKQRLREFVRVVWEGRDLSALPAYWTDDCVNHAAPGPGNVGLDAVRAYHQGFLAGFLPAFSEPKIEYTQQLAEGDRVVSQMVFRAVHTGPLFSEPATGRAVSLSSIRIDRFEGDKIAEHWSVADMAGFMRQLQAS